MVIPYVGRNKNTMDYNVILACNSTACMTIILKCLGCISQPVYMALDGNLAFLLQYGSHYKCVSKTSLRWNQQRGFIIKESLVRGVIGEFEPGPHLKLIINVLLAEWLAFWPSTQSIRVQIPVWTHDWFGFQYNRRSRLWQICVPLQAVNAQV